MKQKDVVKLIIAVLTSTICLQLFARAAASFIDKYVYMPATYEEETANIQGVKEE